MKEKKYIFFMNAKKFKEYNVLPHSFFFWSPATPQGGKTKLKLGKSNAQKKSYAFLV